MASQAVGSKQPQDIEITIIGDVFCLLLGSAGLLAGAMVTNLSLAYWREDIVALGIVAFVGAKLLRNLMDAMTQYQEPPSMPYHRHAEPQERVNVQSEDVVMAQIPAAPSLSPDQVVDEVVKRIETQKAAAAKKNKFMN